MSSLLLTPLSLIYRGFVFARNLAYDNKWFNINRLNRPVISIGNITAGGAGKTPLARYLAETLGRKGFSVALLSRGYRRKRDDNIVFRSSKELKLTADNIGDEPAMLSEMLDEVIFGIGANRFITGSEIIDRFNPDVFLLDDGFQHRKLHRDLDILVVDSHQLFHNEQCLPAGMLREPVENIQRADIIVVKNINDDTSYLRSKESINKLGFDIPVLNGKIKVMGLYDVDSSEKEQLDFITGKRVIAFCGIGNAGGFRKTIEEQGASIQSFIKFRDHHYYSERDIALISGKFAESNAELLLTTMKDAARLKSVTFDCPVYAIDIGYEFDCADEQTLISSVLNIINGFR
ncbi:MAG: tetraacyldisaccharide 4'-kinase [candidate division Zixibacteria bacterium]|nr:tetraacyldisaccharide 4'-kinase [candidate division Zixibacteria bacterium]